MILLTGGTGFLGREIRTIFDNTQLNYGTIGRSSGNSICWNFMSPAPLIPPADMIVHVAGKAHLVPVTKDEKDDFFKVNVSGTQHLLTALETNPAIKKFVFISSVAVYGLEAGSSIKEDSPLLATDPYGKSKIEAEKLVVNWCTQNNINYYIFRLPLVAGKNAPGNLGAMVKGIRNGRYPSIGKATAKKSMVLAADLANFIATLEGPSGIYNLTDGYHPSFKELEHKIAMFYNRKDPFSIPTIAAKTLGIVGDTIGDKFPINSRRLKKIISTLTFDDSKARAQLRWNPREVLSGWEIE